MGRAGEVMKLTSYDLKEFKIIDRIVKEPIGGAHFNIPMTFENAKSVLLEEYYKLNRLSKIELHYQRNNKVRKIGFLQRFNYNNLKGGRK